MDMSNRLLEGYLRDHRVAAAGGLALARRVLRGNVGSPFGARLTPVVEGITADVAALEAVLARRGVRRNRVLEAAAIGIERVARLKVNGTLLRYSPASRVLELESLIGAVSAKAGVWRALALLSEPAAPPTMEELLERGEQQRATLVELHREAAQLAFGPARPMAHRADRSLPGHS